MSAATRYFRTSWMTKEKREWLQKQIDGLEQANRELRIKLNSDQINLVVNERQIDEMKIALKKCHA